MKKVKKIILFDCILFILVGLFALINKTIDKNTINTKNYKEGSGVSALTLLKSKANADSVTYNNGNQAELFYISQEQTDQLNATYDYRYIGGNPNNYVYYNCFDKTDKSTCEIWRIIGIFNVENAKGNIEEKIKIVRDSRVFFEDGNWLDYVTPSNDFTDDWFRSVIKYSLNEHNYWNTLYDDAKAMIDPVKYYLGAINYDEYNSKTELSARELYRIERNSSVYTNIMSWTGKIGLIYPSDYFYTYMDSNQECFNNAFNCNNTNPESSWINKLANPVGIKTLNHVITPWHDAKYSIDHMGYLSIPGGGAGVYPTLYLKNNVNIVSGDGSSSNPYFLSLSNEDGSNYNEYNIGNQITYKNEEYYVIENSTQDEDYIKVIKKTGILDNNTFEYGTTNDYDKSNIKEIMEKWVSDNFNDSNVKIINDTTSRLLSIDDLLNKFSYELVNNEYHPTDNTPNWIIGSNYWVYGNDNNAVYYMDTNGIVKSTNKENRYEIRPVIYLKKCAAENKNCNICELGKKITEKTISKYNSFSYNDTINYQGEVYHVIYDSDKTKKYVTAIKDTPLTSQEITQLNDFNYYSPDGKVPFNSSDTCSSGNHTNCKNIYSVSKVKTIVDNWAKKYDDDLIKVDGYKARLLYYEEVRPVLKYESVEEPPFTYLRKTAQSPDWTSNNDNSYWLMSNCMMRFPEVMCIVSNSTNYDDTYNNNYVRPVVNFNKCSIESGCTTETIRIEEGCNGEQDENTEDSKSAQQKNHIVIVADTLSIISKVLFICSILLLIIGLSIFGYNYYKSRKERK